MIIQNPILTGSVALNGLNLTANNLATTSSNSFTSDQSITGSLGISANTTIAGTLTVTGSIVGLATSASYVLNAVSSSKALSASYSDTASFANSFNVAGNLTASNAVLSGTLTAQTLVVQTITSSIDFVTGSTRFGSLLTNTHTFTGSVSITGSLTVNTTGTEFQVTNNGVVMGNVLTDNHRITGSLMLTGSLTVNSSSFYIGSNNQIGVNTLTPQSQFVVTKAGNNASLEFNLNNTGYSRIFSYDRGVATSTNLVLQDPGGSVGIGITNPSVTFNVGDANHGIGIAYRGSSALPTIAGLFTDTGGSGGSGYGDLLVKARTDYGGFYGINFYTAVSDNTPVLRMRIQSDGVLNLPYGQIQFPASQNASSNANTLDDYEEGTWTPTITAAGSNPSVTYSIQTGFYTKIGRQVFIQGLIYLSSRSGGSGVARISGLPFTVANVDQNYSIGTVGQMQSFSSFYGNVDGQLIVVRANQNETYLSFYESYISNGADWLIGNLGSTFVARFTISYFTS